MVDHDPYRAPELAPKVAVEFPTTERVRAEPTRGYWVPIAIAAVFILGLSYYYRHTPESTPHMRAGAEAVMQSAPSPN